MRIRNRLEGLVLLAFALSALPAAARAQVETLTDGQIAHVLVTAATISVEAAELADRLAIGDQIQSFASALVSDYGESIARIDALSEQLGLSEQDDPVSEALREEADDEVAKIDDLGGLSFDRSYIKRVIEHHRHFLDVLDRDLIPQARNEQLDTLLGDVRAEFAAHLAEAEELAATL